MRTHFIDPDFRRTPKTERYCCVCYRDIKTRSVSVRLTPDWTHVIHPADATDQNSVPAEVGFNCYSKWPVEFQS